MNHVVFIDIGLPGKNGVELARAIYAINPQIALIFATAYDDYTLEAFEVYAYDYLIKPFKLDRIKKTMEKLLQLQSPKVPTPTSSLTLPGGGETVPDRLVVRENEKLVFLDVRDIIFITRENRKTIIITSKNKLSITENLNSIEARLAGENSFFRSHRAYIVNLNMIREIRLLGKKGYEITFSGTQETAILAFNKARELKKYWYLPSS